MLQEVRFGRYVDKVVKSDVWCFYFKRPGVGGRKEVYKKEVDGEVL